MSEPRGMSEKELEKVMLDAMERAGTDKALIHAFKKTGRLVTEENSKHLTQAEIDEWNAAIEEGERLYPKK